MGSLGRSENRGVTAPLRRDGPLRVSSTSFRETWELPLDAVSWWPHRSSTKMRTKGRYLIRAADWPREPWAAGFGVHRQPREQSDRPQPVLTYLPVGGRPTSSRQQSAYGHTPLASSLLCSTRG